MTIVGTAVLVIRASSGTMTYGGSAPTITPSYSGFVNGDDASSLTTAATCSTTATSSSPVGTYPTSCSGAADSNYSISYVTGLVTVEPGAAVDHGLVGVDDLRRLAAGHHSPATPAS